MFLDMSVLLQFIDNENVYRDTTIKSVKYTLDIPRLHTIYTVKELRCCTSETEPFIIKYANSVKPVKFHELCDNYIFADGTPITYKTLIQRCHWRTIGEAVCSRTFGFYCKRIPETVFGFVYTAADIGIQTAKKKIKIMRIPEGITTTQTAFTEVLNSLPQCKDTIIESTKNDIKYIVCPVNYDTITAQEYCDVQNACIITEDVYNTHIDKCDFRENVLDMFVTQ